MQGWKWKLHHPEQLGMTSWVFHLCAWGQATQKKKRWMWTGHFVSFRGPEQRCCHAAYNPAAQVKCVSWCRKTMTLLCQRCQGRNLRICLKQKSSAGASACWRGRRGTRWGGVGYSEGVSWVLEWGRRRKVGSRAEWVSAAYGAQWGKEGNKWEQ